MSGIGAIFYRDGRPVERDDLERMSRSLAIYGPERRAIKADGQCGLVYTHFTNTSEARQDAQPLTSSSGRHLFVFDGRIDNREDLASALAIEAAKLAKMSDASLALAAWEKWGAEGLNRWVGEFAAIIWDRETRETSLLRDHLGRRPLHYHLTDKRLVVASMPKGIHAMGDVPRELDQDRLADVLTQIDIDLTRSYYRNIRCVAPATVSRISAQREQHSKYYAMRDHISPVRLKRDEDYVEAANELFGTVLKACMRSPGKIGSHLSAGMDSSFVAAMAARDLAQKGERLSTYTWVPGEAFSQVPPQGWCFDESPAAYALAEMYPNVDINLIGRDRPSVYEHKREYFLAAESVARNALNLTVAMETGYKAREGAVKVMLTGDGGNNSLSTDGAGVLHELFRTGHWSALLREIYSAKHPNKEWRRFLIDILPSNTVKAVRQGRNPGDTLRHTMMKRSAATQAVFEERRIFERCQTLGFEWGIRADKSASDQSVTLIENYDGPVNANALAAAPALFGHEVRTPFYDRRLLEWRFGVPLSQFRRSGRGRFLMTRLLQGRVPSLMAEQQLGNGIQSADWHSRLAPDIDRMAKDFETARTLPSMQGLIDEEKMETALANFEQAGGTTDVDLLVDYTVLLPLAGSVAAFAIEQSGTNTSS
ncbi:MAG: asparagine synthase-related protein [Pseudomonadota bacterium]